ncbi:hypothetical protein HBI80_129040 [Parastagonospora nodorum]|nr:hypothetical protein HBH46_055620 [Parastagonospora nodorum]KAH4115777.1 hypothetical protein HBH47_175130 [Parastagonospora nodorum]KAH4252684.1 hypothetical protein HBI03_205690 [Parastagonospora nodorum]KAH4276741.1 hypothetical protein HBI04_112800 [Parastagonospora nodorum]KAH4902515.1 hypothetical protein HBI80_129040 [Parastagonospora nodorum]
MNINLFFLSVFCALAYGCVPPFNDFRNLHNATRLSVAIADYKADPQLGWATPIGGPNHAIQAWPTNKDNLVYIPFCYLFDYVKQKNAPVFERAWDLWFRKIGKASKVAGHRLAGFEEMKDANGNSRFCYSSFENDVWNPDVPEDALVIDWDILSATSWSFCGYTPKNMLDKRGRHQMVIGWEYTPHYERFKVVPTIAHEMGHIFGLAHEHQRADRDLYVKYQCENLYGYQIAKSQLPSQPGVTMDMLCNDGTTCREDPWSTIGINCASDYATAQYKDTLVLGKDYDVSSIMHYYSRQAGNWRQGEAVTIHNSPLIKWKNGGKDFTPPSVVNDENAEIIDFTWGRGPSDGDLEGIRAMYPWIG